MLDQCCNYICYKHLHGTLITEFSGYELHKYWKFILLIQKKITVWALPCGSLILHDWNNSPLFILQVILCKRNQVFKRNFFYEYAHSKKSLKLWFSVYITSFINIYVCHLIPVNGIFLLSIKKLNADRNCKISTWYSIQISIKGFSLPTYLLNIVHNVL